MPLPLRVKLQWVLTKHLDMDINQRNQQSKLGFKLAIKLEEGMLLALGIHWAFLPIVHRTPRLALTSPSQPINPLVPLLSIGLNALLFYLWGPYNGNRTPTL